MHVIVRKLKYNYLMNNVSKWHNWFQLSIISSPYSLILLCLLVKVKKLEREKRLDAIVDRNLNRNYDIQEVEMMIQVALLCTQPSPEDRPAMSEVVRMLEGDGLAEKWEATQRAEATRCKANEFSSSERYSDLTDDSSLLVQAMELSGPR